MTAMGTSRHIPSTEVAKLVRKDLRAAFKGVKFSVRTDKYSGGSSIRVNWADGPTEDKVKEVAGHYCGATFDGMTDSKNYHDTMVMTEDGPEVVSYGNDYIQFSREISEEGRAQLITRIAEDNPWRTFGPDFPDEIIADEADRFAPVGERSILNAYIYRGWDLIHFYANVTDLSL